jgi:hypothetical protein
MAFFVVLALISNLLTDFGGQSGQREEPASP